MSFTLDADAVRAIVDHLNDDHPEDTLLLARELGGLPGATQARASSIDVAGLDLSVELADGEVVEVRLPFDEPVTERAEVRHRVVALYDRASRAT